MELDHRYPGKRLMKAQREAVLEWVSAGYDAAEIDKRAAAFDPPFTMSRGLIQYYRGVAGAKIGEIVEAGKVEALQTGLARVEERVKRLELLAEAMEEDLFAEGRLWVETVRTANKEPIWLDEFNAAEVAQYRGVLDDIAREVGGRQVKIDQTVRAELRWDWEIPTTSNL